MSFTPQAFARELATTLAPLQQGTGVLPSLCVALSGGLDSTVLLAALAQSRREAAMAAAPACRALHVDHGLHPASRDWARACAELAAAWQVPFGSVRVDARPQPGESPEAAARRARYAGLAAQLQPGEVLLTAHQADDQLETVLLQWLRGGGLNAVAGMAPLVRFADRAWHARPLLAFPREALRRWAVQQQLRWNEDPSNVDPRFDRNYLRLAVLPPLRARWPAAAHTIARVAVYAREALELEAAVAADDLAGARRGRALALQPLLALPEPRRRSVVRAWLAALGLPMPASHTLAALLRDVTVAGGDRVPRTEWPGAIVHRYRDHLHAQPAPVAAVPSDGQWHDPPGSPLPWGDGTLRLVPAEGAGLSRARLPASLQVTTRAGGEHFIPAGGAHRRPLRKWLQERGVLPWQRARLPMLRDDEGRLVAIADLGCSAPFAADAGEPAWRVQWEGRGVVTESDAFAFRW